MHRRKPSLTSLIAFCLIVSPLAYVLSYAPVVRFYGETEPDLDTPWVSGVPSPLADASLYPPYKPVDWLIDNTSLRTPLFFWAEIWGVRTAFENGNVVRTPLPPLPPFGAVEPGRAWEGP